MALPRKARAGTPVQAKALRRTLAILRDGRPDLALPQLRRLARVHPKHPVIILSLATSILRTGNAREALKLFNTLLKTDPQDTRALMGRGHCLHGTGDLQGALDAFRKVVAAEPLSWRAWRSIADITPHEDERVHAIEGAADALFILSQGENPSDELSANLTTALLEARTPARALQVLSSRPSGPETDPSFIRQRARSLYLAGQYEAAFTETTRLLRALPSYPRNTTPLPPFDPDRATEVLAGILDILTAAGAQCFLAAGTLLGFHRNGGPLAHDRDIDIGVLREPGGGPDIAGILRNAPGILLPRIARPGDRYFGLMHKGVAVDIFVHDRQDLHTVFGFSHTKGDIQWRVTGFGLRTATYGGHLWRVPAHAERYLSELYGPSWQVPDPGFASAVSSPALHETDLHARACCAVIRSIRALTSGNPAKAQALLGQSPVPVSGHSPEAMEDPGNTPDRLT